MFPSLTHHCISSKIYGQEHQTALEDELARYRLKLESEYRNPDGKGFTYVDDDGVRIPLDTGMLSYWARRIVSFHFSCLIVDINVES